MTTEPDTTHERTGSPADACSPPTGRSEQEEYEFIMGQVAAILGRLDAQMPVASARLDSIVERIKSRSPQ